AVRRQRGDAEPRLRAPLPGGGGAGTRRRGDAETRRPGRPLSPRLRVPASPRPSPLDGTAPLAGGRAAACGAAGGGCVCGRVRGAEPAGVLVSPALWRRGGGAGTALLRDQSALGGVAARRGAGGGAVWAAEHRRVQPPAVERAARF